jgi:ubiquinone/menaquinone biosynthesis C-methylase UbiE
MERCLTGRTTESHDLSTDVEMERVPEPELMNDVAQAEAYARADFVEVNAGFVARFVATFPDLARGRVVDVGCGPADIPIRLARARPELRITAVDGAGAMLALAADAIRAARVPVALVRATVPALPFRRRTFDAVVSNSLLHHLPDPLVLWREVARLLQPGGAVLVMDLARPDSPSRATDIVETYAANEADVLKRDFHASLLAAFTPDEVRRQLAAILPGVRCETVSDRHWLVSGRV